MLRRWNSQTPLYGVLVEHRCPRCSREVELPLGALCANCIKGIERRARNIARIVAGVTTLMLAVYVLVRVPADPTARLVGGLGVAAWYILSGVVVRRTLREALK